MRGVVDRGQVAGAAGLELGHPVFDVGLGAVSGVEELDLSAGGVGDERAVLPVGVLPELGRLGRWPRGAPGDQPHTPRPGRQPVGARAVAHDPGQVRHLRGGVDVAVGVHRGAPVALG